MQQTITKENFNQLLGNFSISDLENITDKFPYFHQAHLLLAKKYQQENNPKFDEQLQLAALYTQDKELFFSLFNEKNLPTKNTFFSSENIVEQKQAFVLPENAIEQVAQKTEANEAVEISIEQTAVEEIMLEEKTSDEIISTEEVVIEKEIVQEQIIEEPQPTFITTEPHTFNEWLNAFSPTNNSEIKFDEEKLSEEIEKQDEELEQLIIANLPIQELMQEETHYAKGLDNFIEEQKLKRKLSEIKINSKENELPPELITETVANLYVAQKKYANAIRAYEILALKYPEKSDLFAARISELKNF